MSKIFCPLMLAALLILSCSAEETNGDGPDGGHSGNDSGASTGGAPGSGGGSASGGANTGSGGVAAVDGSTNTGGSSGDDAGSASGGADSGPRGYPDETNTGPDLTACPNGMLEPYVGDDPYRPETGVVVSCMEFEDVSIYIPSDVSNVTIENCRFITSVDLFINIQGSGVTIQDSEFHGPAGTWIRNSYSGDHLTVRRNEFTGMANAVEFNVGNETLEDNFVHDFGTVDSEQHADGLQTDGSSNVIVRHNTVLLNDVAGATGAIAIMGDSGDDVLVENNRVAGGGYTIYPGGPQYTNIRFLNNCFSTMFYPGEARSGAYGPWYPSSNPPDLVRTGNTWCDGPQAGEPLDDNP